MLKINALNGKSFKYKTIIVGKTPERLAQFWNPEDTNQAAQPKVPVLKVEVIIPLQYLSGIWRFLDKLWSRTWFIIDKKNCALIEHHNNMNKFYNY